MERGLAWAEETRREIDELLGALLDATSASRTTLRLRAADGTYPIVAESLAEGVNGLRDSGMNDFRGVATFEFLRSERRMLVQEDVTDTDVPPPPALIDVYGALSQMLGPLVDGDDLVGYVSVHCSRRRPWSSADRLALERATSVLDRWRRAAM